MATTAQVIEKPDYLNADYSIKSWLLTTDHKRIALLYLVSITFFFFIGGFFAMLIRLELLTPAGDLVRSDTYNRLFTMHGVVMIFLFLIPSIPAAIGNFVVADTTTNGRVKCTTSYPAAGSLIGIAMAAQSTVGNSFNVMVGLR